METTDIPNVFIEIAEELISVPAPHGKWSNTRLLSLLYFHTFNIEVVKMFLQHDLDCQKIWQKVGEVIILKMLWQKMSNERDSLMSNSTVVSQRTMVKVLVGQGELEKEEASVEFRARKRSAPDISADYVISLPYSTSIYKWVSLEGR